MPQKREQLGRSGVLMKVLSVDGQETAHEAARDLKHGPVLRPFRAMRFKDCFEFVIVLHRHMSRFDEGRLQEHVSLLGNRPARCWLRSASTGKSGETSWRLSSL